jgi:hypothetical protein
MLMLKRVSLLVALAFGSSTLMAGKNECWFHLVELHHVQPVHSILPHDLKVAFTNYLESLNNMADLETGDPLEGFFRDSQVQYSLDKIVRRRSQGNPEEALIIYRMLASNIRIVLAHLLYFNGRLPETKSAAALSIMRELSSRSAKGSISRALADGNADGKGFEEIDTDEMHTISEDMQALVKEIFPQMQWPLRSVPPIMHLKPLSEMEFARSTLQGYKVILADVTSSVERHLRSDLSSEALSAGIAEIAYQVASEIESYSRALPTVTDPAFDHLVENFRKVAIELSRSKEPANRHISNVLKLAMKGDDKQRRKLVLESSLMLSDLRDFFPERRAPYPANPSADLRAVREVDAYRLGYMHPTELSAALRHLINNGYFKAAISLYTSRPFSDFGDLKERYESRLLDFSKERLDYFAGHSVDAESGVGPAQGEVGYYLDVLERLDPVGLTFMNNLLESASMNPHSAPELITRLSERLAALN